VRRADNLTTFVCRLSWNLGSSSSWNPLALNRPEQGLPYLVYVSVGCRQCSVIIFPAGSKDFCLLQNTQTSFGAAHRRAPVSLKRPGRQVTAHFHHVPRLRMIVVAHLHPLCEGAALLAACFPPTSVFMTAFDEAHVLLNFKLTSWRHILVYDSGDLKRWPLDGLLLRSVHI
jgi:hypothetical protein